MNSDQDEEYCEFTDLEEGLMKQVSALKDTVEDLQDTIEMLEEQVYFLKQQVPSRATEASFKGVF